MDKSTRVNLDNLWSQDRALQNKAFLQILKSTDKPVDWAYDVWDRLLDGLHDKDNHVRAIAAQVLCNLAKSDPKQRMLKDLPKLLAVTKDERFVTARHCMQALWKVGVTGPKQRHALVRGLEHRFKECISEKNCSLNRHDIVVSLWNVYGAVKDAAVKEKALELIESESDLKYRKKYASVWRRK
jgi:hypothetical protein